HRWSSSLMLCASRSCCHLLFFFSCYGHHRDLHSFPTRRSSDLRRKRRGHLRAGGGLDRAAHGGGGPQHLAAGRLRNFASAGHSQDRKSTRLNSSHVKISYAVFCLKKKNTTEAAG